MGKRLPLLCARKRNGMTLIELLVSLAVFALISVLLFGLFSATQNTSSILLGQGLQRQDAAWVLHSMSQELRTALRSVSGTDESIFPWDTPAGRNLSRVAPSRQAALLINPAGIQEPLRHVNTVFWLSESSRAGEPPKLVGYAVRYDQTSEGPRPRLLRLEADRQSAFSSLERLRDPDTTEGGSAGGGPRWVTTDLLSELAPGTTDEAFQGWVSDTVLALFVWALDPEMKPILLPVRPTRGIEYVRAGGIRYDNEVRTLMHQSGPFFDSMSGYQYRRTTDSNRVVNVFGPAFPASVQIVLVAATPQAIRSLQEVPTIPPNYWNRVENHNTLPSWNPWQQVDEFVDGLPEVVRRGTRIYSTAVPVLSPES